MDIPRIYEDDWADLWEEWLVFAGNLCHGYDIERTVLDLAQGKWEPGSKVKVEVAADRGWQSSGVLVVAGKTYVISAAGKFVLAQEPKLWESEPQGISIRYHAGLPLGMLVAAIRSTRPGSSPPPSRTTMLNVLPIGRERLLKPAVTGTLYFRVNDFWNELADNRGLVQVTVEEAGGR